MFRFQEQSPSIDPTISPLSFCSDFTPLAASVIAFGRHHHDVELLSHS